MSSLRYKVVLKTSHKYVDRVEKCLATWLRDLDYVCLTDHITGKFNEISGSENDTYNSNEEKTITLMNLIRETDLYNDYDWLIFIDDDAILNVKYFEYLLPFLDKTKFYGLWMNGCPMKPELPFPSGGASYFISPAFIKNMKPMTKPHWSSGGTEDVVVGNWLDENDQKIHQTVMIEEKEHFFKLNGWWPFHEELKTLRVFEQTVPNYKELVIQKAVTKETERKILTHVTHHYIKEMCEIEYIHNLFKVWTPEYL